MGKLKGSNKKGDRIMELTPEEKSVLAAQETQKACELAAGGHHKCGLVPASFGTSSKQR